MSAINVEGLQKSYRDRVVLNSIGFDLQAGRALALFGPSGCGKTTLLHILAGLAQPDCGRVCLRGETMNEGRESISPEQRHVGMVFQDLALWPHLRADRHLDFVARHSIPDRAARATRVAAELAEAGLETLARVRPGRMSGGEQQRLAIARALIQDRDILLLDEPFSHLDDTWRERVVARLRELKAKDTTIIFATHRREDIDALADHVLAFTANGTTLQAGSSFN